MNTYSGHAPQHWRQEVDADKICWLRLDKKDSSANTLSQDVMLELDTLLDGLATDTLKGVVIISAKAKGFILGADVNEFGAIKTATEGARFSSEGQRILAKLASLPCPTVAAMNGFALGGGLELALACNYRIAVRGYKRTLGLPEVKLGIHPGFGGTVRLVQLLGAVRALNMMLNGHSVSPIEAEDDGLVDALVAGEELEAAARHMIGARPAPRRAPWHLRWLNLRPVRASLYARIKQHLATRVDPQHYPAPYALLDLWKQNGSRGTRAYQAEADSIGRLIVTPAAQNLVRLFKLRERMKTLAPGGQTFDRIHVIGAGVMGGDIAAWCALRGLSVTLQDRAMEFIEPALKRANKLFEKRLKAPGEAEEAAGRLTADLSGTSANDADIVIEAIVEDLDVKTSLFSELEPKLGNATIIASNTSSIQLEKMASALAEPNRFVGLHFFNPVASLPLVEVIRAESTDDASFQRALAFVTRIGKLPLPCKSAPGFVVNRVLTPYLLEALRAHEDGYSFETIDAAATTFGMPVGPVELADRVGLDVALHVARILADELKTPPPPILETMVADGQLGAKTEQGFYTYKDGHAQKDRTPSPPDDELTDRLILLLVNAAVECLATGAIDDPELLDAGVVLGTGFAPFTGGPLHYAKRRGIDNVLSQLAQLEKQHGIRFATSTGWSTLT